ncbi:hypothetical protein NP493_456g01018 [Ridgeia piscesae]|uniref:BZIP domain-containing protein n=1 Tax=Ridgeia piscesae TaxID=27915 RepID=A0AAD9L085_RIDPI|nr:hypothetical protein NP493_456g01018 [Ridgeia piscesae]
MAASAMETGSFYADEHHGKDMLSKLKSNMTLDFNTRKTRAAKIEALLASPDLNMLKLASPELEKMLLASGSVTTTPTPTQFIFPRSVTEEQEAYARGFVDALEQLHQTDGIPYQGDDESEKEPATVSTSTYTELSTRRPTPAVTTQCPTTLSTDLAPFVTTTSLPGARLPICSTQMGATTAGPSIPVYRDRSPLGLPARVKEEPQTVPCLGSTPPMSPINLECQERIKLERKRARNRVAARKCRTRKLERISRLEDRVAILKGQNNNLSDTAKSLRDQVFKLKQEIVEHVNSGCQMMVSQSSGSLL